ncbi:hypothetical protein BRADI_1g77093v3 [Brachypodium distachyon]|uniref:Wax synthase domain-containing protein n=1 Tax=Brachypodium distachyon TaxID=15368 RepID=A0A2K2DVJ2_BRADI|nr:hypothetical protein BRADI_1g77093v3 [Brachypodium distachyon]
MLSLVLAVSTLWHLLSDVPLPLRLALCTRWVTTAPWKLDSVRDWRGRPNFINFSLLNS